jgi:hypothetical protein
MITDTNLESSSDEESSTKQKKRKLQNVKAAHKSYLAKKQWRENLQQRNTELMETQMKLLHEKSRLQERVTLLSRVVSSFQHVVQPCWDANSPIPELERRSEDQLAQSGKKSPFVGIIVDNDNMLDASEANECLTSCCDHLKNPGNSNTSKNAFAVNENQDQCDIHIYDESFLGVGATQEVIHEKRLKVRRCSNNNIIVHEDVFIPKVNKQKASNNVSPARPIRGCATDVLRKQCPNRITERVGERSLL